MYLVRLAPQCCAFSSNSCFVLNHQTISGINTALLTLCPPALRMIVQERASRFFVGYRPTCLYPLSTWHNYMWPDLPGLPLRICILQVEVGIAWKWGYEIGLCQASMFVRYCWLNTTKKSLNIHQSLFLVMRGWGLGTPSPPPHHHTHTHTHREFLNLSLLRVVLSIDLERRWQF